MLRIAIIASRDEYQQAAAWAAATFTLQLKERGCVFVLLPEQESPVALLRAHAERFGFIIHHFPFKASGDAKYISQLKCQGFYYAVSQIENDELLFIVDADTYCRKALTLAPEVENAILGAKIGLVPDVKDRHCRRPMMPWYLPEENMATYVNSGVILTSRYSLDMFSVFKEISRRPQFLRGPFNDQKVINFAIGKHFKDRLILLDKNYNGMRQYVSSTTIIGHCAGGAGRYTSNPTFRKDQHERICAEIIEDYTRKSRSDI